MSFGDVIRSASSPAGSPYGMGGNVNVIWHCNINRVHELSTSDLSSIRNASPPSNFAIGIGGDENNIWHSEYVAVKLYKLSTTDFSVIRSASSPGSEPTGIGGNASVIWHTRYPNSIYELSTSNFSVIRSGNTPATWAYGVGGNTTEIWLCDTKDKTYELDPSDFSIVREASSPSSSPTGIGGDSDTIWHCDLTADRVYELDATSVFTLSGTISDEFGNPIRDADITISDGTTYTTTTDENGAYSQIVNSDTYDIAVSKSRSRFHDTTESSVAVTADTTQDITMPTDKMLGRPTIVNGMSIPGGILMGRSRR